MDEGILKDCGEKKEREVQNVSVYLSAHSHFCNEH